MTEVKFVGVPAPIVAAALADLSGWRILGERMLEASKRLCPVGKEQDAARMGTYGQPHGGVHLKDTMEVRFEYGIDPRIMVGSTLTRGEDGVSALGLVEFGTEAHSIDSAPGGPALRFSGNGVVLYRRHVDHPGTKENKFVERAMRTVILESVSII